MGREVNLESIRALEKQIEERIGDTIELKRARNSLLNISILVPPEILGEIFFWILARPDPALHPDSHFDGFCQGSHNFLLVCRHWARVASRTPEIWSFWGNTLLEWKKWHHRHPMNAPLALELTSYDVDMYFSFDDALENKLRECARRGTIRQVHLYSDRPNLLTSIISSLTPRTEGVHLRSIESINLEWLGLEDTGIPESVISSFFSRIHLPRLRSLMFLDVSGVPWGHLAQQTTLLTNLSFKRSRDPPSPPTIPQLFKILTSNPGLQLLFLDGLVNPNDGEVGPVPRATLSHLKWLSLSGEHHLVFWLLDQLVFPHPLKRIRLSLYNSTPGHISQTLRSYLQRYFPSDHEFQGRLRVRINYSYPFFNNFVFRVRTEDETYSSNPFSVKFVIPQAQNPSPEAMQHVYLGLVASIPRERIRSLDARVPMNKLEDLLITMPNIEILELHSVALSEGFLQPSTDRPHAETKLLPSLRYLHLDLVNMEDNGWKYLVAYLAHQSSGGQAFGSRQQAMVTCAQMLQTR